MSSASVRLAGAALAASVMLFCGGGAEALQLDIKDIFADRAARKRAAALGKLPLPGTPDLDRLEERLAERGVPADASMLIRIFKAESELEVWMTTQEGTYSLFATYPICFWSGTLGPKLREGDRQAPEGFYTVALDQAHPGGRRWPEAINIGFPNPFDKVHARSGSHILIHGGCASIGCFAMTNAVNDEVHKLAVRALNGGQPYVHVHAFPFRMTAENLARHEQSEWKEFWSNLKEGYDIFERTHRPPRVSVCENRYKFVAASQIESLNPGPIAVCPTTAAVIAELEKINAGVIETGSLPTPAKPAFALLPAYLGGPVSEDRARQGPNSLVQLAPARASSGSVLDRPLPCSLALPSCRKYAALRERIAYKVVLESERAIAKKKRHATIKKLKKKKKRLAKKGKGQRRKYASRR